MRKKVIKANPKKMTLTDQRAKEKVRLAIECTSEERKYIKMFAAHQDMTLNDFVLDCVRARITGCKHSHIPNKETADALDATERGEGLIHYNSIEDFFKSLS